MKLTVFYYYADFFAFFLLVVILARAATLSLSLHIDWSSRGLSKKKSISQSPYLFIIYGDQGDNP